MYPPKLAVSGKGTFALKPQFHQLVCFLFVCLFVFHTSLLTQNQTRTKAFHYVLTLLAVVRLFPFHFADPLGFHTFFFAPYLFQTHSLDIGELASVKPFFKACSTLGNAAATWLQVDLKLKEKQKVKPIVLQFIVHINQSLTRQNMWNTLSPLYHLAF